MCLGLDVHPAHAFSPIKFVKRFWLDALCVQQHCAFPSSLSVVRSFFAMGRKKQEPKKPLSLWLD